MVKTLDRETPQGSPCQPVKIFVSLGVQLQCRMSDLNLATFKPRPIGESLTMAIKLPPPLRSERANS